jgi:pimeloyl-ACP methyl ester carboxylesterase
MARVTVLIGYSLGGLVAFGVAARLPDLVAGVIAIDPPFVLRDSDFEATAYSDAHDWIRWVNDVVGGALIPFRGGGSVHRDEPWN